MIFTERTIRVSNGTSSISSPIILYKGDKNIKIRFRIVDCPYTYSKNVDNIIETSEVSYAQLIIKTPNDGTPIFSDIAEPENGYVTFIITSEMIDEAQEVGKYTLQIRLLDDEQYGRITIPEVVDGIEVREPIAIEVVSTTNEVDVAVANYAVTTAATAENVFDSEGNYIETNWQSGDRITSAKLNKIEQGIAGVNEKVTSGGGTNNINDEVVSTTTTYSSNKIETSFLSKNSELNGRQLKEASVSMTALNMSETMAKYDVSKIIWEVGNISSNAGTLLVRENRIRTKDFIEIVNKEEIELLNTASNSYNILLYDYSTEAFIKSIEGGFGKNKYISDGHYKMKIVIKNDDETVINVNTFVASEVISISKPIDLTDFVDYNRFEGISKKTDFPIINVRYEKVELPQAVSQDCCVVGNEIWMWRDREGYVAINGDDFTKIREKGGNWSHGNSVDYIDNVMLNCDTTNPYFFIYHNIKDKGSISAVDDPDRVQVNLTKTATDGSTVTFAPVEGSGCFGETKYIMYYLDYDKSDMDRNMVLHKILLGYGDNNLSDTSVEKNSLTNFGEFKAGCDENTFNGTFKVLKSFTGNLSSRDNRPQGMTYDGKIYVVGGFEELRCNVIEIDEKTNRYCITHRLKYNTSDYKNNHINHESQCVFIHKNELYVGAKNLTYFFKTHIY